MITLHPGKLLRPVLRHTLILCLLAGLSACGQKGPLYLPEPAHETDGSEQAN